MRESKINQSLSEQKILKDQGYKLLSVLGEGSYAKVLLAEFNPRKTEQVYVVACKILDTKKAPKKFVTKFLPRELKILSKLNHPHIIDIHSIFQRKSKYFIFMRNAENGDLLHFMLKNGVIHEKQARIWVRQLGLAIQYLHTLEIAHRDLKCENILVTSNYNVKLSDFGFSRFVVNKDNRREFSETFCGSLSYAPPEILRGRPYNPKVSDLWSFGVVIYMMLNKAYPFDDKHVKTLYHQQIEKNWKFRSRYNDSISKEAKEIVRHLLEPDVLERYKIEQVIGSSWIAMDSSLRSMKAYEYEALQKALEESRSRSIEIVPAEGPSRRSTSSYGNRRFSSKNEGVMFFKQNESEFGLKYLKSELNKKEEKMSS